MSFAPNLRTIRTCFLQIVVAQATLPAGIRDDFAVQNINMFFTIHANNDVMLSI